MIKLKKKIAILSHVLPPAPSGHSAMIYRLLSGISLKSYCLISTEDYGEFNPNSFGSNYLPAKYYTLKSIIGGHTRFSRFIINPILKIFSRAKQIRKILKSEKCDIIVVFTGDLYNLPAAALACKFSKIQFIPYLVDWYAYQWTGHQRKFSKFIEPILLTEATSTLVLNEYLSKELQDRYNIKTKVIRHPISMPNLDQIDKSPNIYNATNVNIVFTGAIYEANFDAIRNFILALEKLGREDIKFHIFTFIPKKYLVKNGIKSPNIILHKYVKESEVSIVLRKADILFLPLAFHSPYPEVIRTSAPTKMGEYMAVGKPILVHAPSDSFMCEYYKKNGAAKVVDKDDVESLLIGLKSLIEDDSLRGNLGKNALKYAKKDFEITMIQKRFVDYINSFS